jgi:SNF2-related domain
LLVARVPLHSQAGPEWPKGAWQEVEQIYERATFRALSWLLERIKVVDGSFNTWQAVELPGDHSNCERCAPLAPSLRWTKQGKMVKAIEDSAEAGEYERRLKRRPAPFVTQLKLDDNGVGTVRIGVNIASLTHRAFARLPIAGRKGKPTLSWRLDTNFKPLVKLILPKFTLLSNRPDPQHGQPPHFEKFPLRVEQLRSLHWMLEQEKPDAPPFIEEEVSEAMLEPLGWRAEGRAQQPVHIRGGVLADQVGYGKTAITLGMVDCTRKEVARELEGAAEIPGKIRVKATLVVVPPHLTRQWSTEIKKFVSPKAKMQVVTLITASNLNPRTVEEILEADIVIVASNLFRSSVYLANLEAIAAGGSLPASDGRYFKARLDTSLETLKGQVDLLRKKGSISVMDAIHAARKRGMSVPSTL